MNIDELTYVTTCKGRLQHLKQTLPRVVAQGLKNIIVVDFDCPDGTQKWVNENFPQVKVVKVENEPQFHHSRARNMGGRAVTTKWIAFIDADALLSNKFFEIVCPLLTPRRYYIADNPDGNTWGSLVVEKSSFDMTEGYDEAVGNWGGDDIAFFNLLNFVGVRADKYDGSLISSIKHEDSLRIQFTSEKNIELALQMAIIYEECKLDAMRVVGGLMPLEARIALRQAIRTALTNARNGNGQSRSISFQLPPFTTVRPRLGEKRSPVIGKTLTFDVSFRK